MTDQKIALITGGSRGLGLAVALALAGEGIDTIITYRSKKTEAEAVVASVAELGRTAVAFPLDTGTVSTFDDFDDLVNVHLKGVLFLTQKLLPLIADGGSIVNYSIGLTRFVGDGQSAYAAMKGAIEVLTRYQPKELGPRGIRVNTIAPGPIATDFGGGVMQTEGFGAAMGARAALGRAGEPEDVGGAIASLVSDGSRWITGQRIEVPGGTLL
ncbi:MAG: hypothetical protein JWP75_3815 [Frondihabitans sp.]|nr:hypothetical protein [Frondihabitans sp.]